MTEYLEVDVFVFGKYKGKTKVHKDSLVGRLATGDYTEAMSKARYMLRDIAVITENDVLDEVTT